MRRIEAISRGKGVQKESMFKLSGSTEQKKPAEEANLPQLARPPLHFCTEQEKTTGPRSAASSVPERQYTP